MKSKKMLAFVMALCMAFSGAVPVGAVSGNAEIPDQQTGQVSESISGDGVLSQEQQEDQIEGDGSQGDSDQMPEGSQVPEGPEVSGDAASVPDDGSSADQGVSENGTDVSGNEALEDGSVVESPKWIKDTDRYKLEKPGGDGYFSETDGLVTVKDPEGGQVYYAFDTEGYMRTGSHELSVNVELQGVYYFMAAEDCQDIKDPTPENSKLGQMVTQPGWHYAPGEGKWLYIQESYVWDKEKVGKQKVSDGNTYFLDEKDGTVKKNVWEKIDGNTYYFGTDGVMAANGTKKINGSTYYFGTDGVMAANRFVTVSQGKQYYFVNDGKRFEKTEWQRLDNKFYYFDKDYSRRIKTGWQEIKEKNVKAWYYFSSKGEMYANKLFKSKGYQYYVNSTGKMMTGLQQVSGKPYFFRTKDEGKYPIGSAYTGWKKISGRWYYFKKNFQAETSALASIGKKYYSFDNSGRMYKGGWKVVNKKTYYFEKQTAKKRNGYAVTSTWLKKGKKWYYASSKGAMRTDAWVKYKKNYYYLDKNGVMVTNKWKERNGKWGYLNSDGIFSINWIKIDGKWKYAKSDGKFAKGWTYITHNGTRYKFFFNNKGYLVQDLRKKVSGPYMLKVDRKRNQITVYAKDTNGQYIIPVIAMPCSVGLPATPTSVGRFTGTRAGRWQVLMGPSWGQYATHVVDGIFIHSVAGAAPNPYSLPADEWNKLGRQAASHGCIRVAVADAKWIYENCNGCTVEVQDYTHAGPFDHKVYRKISPVYNWDPTDPAAKGYI